MTTISMKIQNPKVHKKPLSLDENDEEIFFVATYERRGFTIHEEIVVRWDGNVPTESHIFTLDWLVRITPWLSYGFYDEEDRFYHLEEVSKCAENIGHVQKSRAYEPKHRSHGNANTN